MIINGRMVVEKGKVLTVDEEEILAGLRLREKDLKSRLNISEMVVSPWKFV